MHAYKSTLTRYNSRISEIMIVSIKISMRKMRVTYIKDVDYVFRYNTCTLFNQFGIHAFVFKNSNIGVWDELLRHAKTFS